MEIRARTKDSVFILSLFGRIDVDSASLIEAFGQSLRDGYRDIVCNFEEVDFVDYLGVSALAIAYRDVVTHEGRLKFACVPGHLKNIFSVTGLDRVIDMYGTEDAAIHALKEDTAIENIRKMQLRRRFKRLPIDLKVELFDAATPHVSCTKVDIINLSAIGAYIYGCNAFKLGDMVVLKFKLPTADELYQLQAKVVWLPDKQIQNHLQPGMGVEFVNLSCDVQEKIVTFVERNKSFLSREE